MWVSIALILCFTAANPSPRVLNPKEVFLDSESFNSSSEHGVLLPLYSKVLSSVPISFRGAFAYKVSSRFPLQVTSLNLVVQVTMGNPPQKQEMVVDTGSELSWLECNPLSAPGSTFNPILSTTYRPIPCSSTVCTKETNNFPVPTACNSNRLCQYSYSYADGTFADGILGSDTVNLSPIHGSPALKIPNFVFGCVPLPVPDTPGLMGLSQGSLSFISQMQPNTNPGRKFSYCIPDPVLYPQSAGILLFGDSPFSKYLHYTPLYTQSIPLPYFNRVAYTVKLYGIKVGRRLLSIPPTVFLPDNTGAGQTMVDSGTQFSFLLGAAYTPLRQAFLAHNRGTLNPVQVNFPNFQGPMDLCFAHPAGAPFPEVTPVTLLFDSALLRLDSHQVLYPVPKEIAGAQNNRTIYCFTFGNSDSVPMYLNIIGNYHQQNLWIEYDLQNSRIGFARAVCNIT